MLHMYVWHLKWPMQQRKKMLCLLICLTCGYKFKVLHDPYGTQYR